MISCGGRMSITSPSVWREWIEMVVIITVFCRRLSPSVWREWIEI